MNRTLKHLLENQFVDSALIIGLVTVLSYVLTYLYESEYLQYFGVGRSGARVELEPLLSTSLIVFLVGGVVVGVLIYLFKHATVNKTGVRKKLKKLVFLAAFLGLAFAPLIHAENPDNFLKSLLIQLIQMAILIIGATIITFLIGLFSKDVVEKTVQKGTKIARRGIIIFVPLITVVILFTYTHLFSLSSAYNAHEFKVIEYKGSSAIVIREYRERFVAVKYDEKTNKILNEYFYINLGETPDIRYEVVNKKPYYKSRYLAELQQQSPTFIDIHKNFPFISFKISQ